jgi:Mitochondrial carrier protein
MQSLRTSGPASLWHSLLPHCVEGVPYDVSELLVVGAGKDMRAHPATVELFPRPEVYDLVVGGLAGTVAVLVSMPFDRCAAYIQGLAAALAAAAVERGPAAPAQAVAAAAQHNTCPVPPSHCIMRSIKTYVQTHGRTASAPGAGGGGAVSGGVWSSGREFIAAGRTLVARGGPRALFVGLAPRLAHQVPGEVLFTGRVCSEATTISTVLYTAHAHGTWLAFAVLTLLLSLLLCRSHGVLVCH